MAYEKVQYSKSQISSAIKRINERLADFERKGFTESQAYDTLYQLAKDLNNQNVIKSASGYTKIQGTGVKLNATQIKTLMFHAKRKNTVGRTIKSGAKELGLKPNKKNQYTKTDLERIRKQVKENKEVHDFIQEHKNDIYDVKYLTNAVRKSEKLTPQERDDLMSMYENPNYYDENGLWIGDGDLDFEEYDG